MNCTEDPDEFAYQDCECAIIVEPFSDAEWERLKTVEHVNEWNMSISCSLWLEDAGSALDPGHRASFAIGDGRYTELLRPTDAMSPWPVPLAGADHQILFVLRHWV